MVASAVSETSAPMAQITRVIRVMNESPKLVVVEFIRVVPSSGLVPQRGGALRTIPAAASPASGESEIAGTAETKRSERGMSALQQAI
jgi:hypothetical protein